MKFRALFALAAILGSLWVTPAAAEDAVLKLAVRFHVTEGAVITVDGQQMTVWVTPEDLERVVLPEVNRIWRQANIQFEIERNQLEPLLSPSNREALIANVENAKRDDDASQQALRTASIAQLLDPAEFHPTAHNVYLLPYVGSTYQGYAKMSGRQIVVGVWTNKASKGLRAPVKTLLVESEPMKVGSLARTLAHELGHNLGLPHPEKDDPVTGRLMGGRVQGYLLTDEEIASAREIARKNIERHNATAKPDPEL